MVKAEIARSLHGDPRRLKDAAAPPLEVSPAERYLGLVKTNSVEPGVRWL